MTANYGKQIFVEIDFNKNDPGLTENAQNLRYATLIMCFILRVHRIESWN